MKPPLHAAKPAMVRLRLTQFVRTGECGHVARCRMDPNHRAPPHTHDFHELFWVIDGTGVHILNGEPQPLVRGQLHLVRATDAHTFEGQVTIINVAFARARWRELERRYVAPERPTPRQALLTSTDLRGLDLDVAELAAGDRGPLATDRLLLNLLRLLHRDATRAATVAPPEWMIHALRDVERDPRHFQSTRAFATLTGHSPEHVARTLRRHLGQSPTEVINAARMRYAARRLTDGSEPVIDVALACGFESLGHFYRVFTRAHGMPPHRYRQQQQAILGR